MGYQLETFYSRSGHITLYKRPGKNPRWTMRLSIPGYKQYITKSTGTADKSLATSIAESAWDEAYLCAKHGVSPKGYKLSEVFTTWANTIYATETNKRKPVLKMLRYFSYFDKYSLTDITQLKVDSYWQWRKEYWHNRPLQGNAKMYPTITTLRGEAGKLTAFWKWAVARGYAQKHLDFRPQNYRETYNKRNALSDNQISQILKQIKANTGQTVSKYNHSVLHKLVLFIQHTGIRPGTEMRFKWSDIEYVGENSFVTVVGKTGRRTIVANANATKALKQLYKISKHTDKHCYVFSNHQGKCKPVLWSITFKNILEQLDYTENTTFYSLRHSYITTKLEEGVSIFVIATQCGTSIEQIQNHYSHVDIRNLESQLLR